MKTFNISDLTKEAYSNFPEAYPRPVIGLTANHSDLDATVREAYCQQVVAAGGVPVIIPPITDTEVAINTLDTIDAIIFTGGGDYNPLWAGEEPSPNLHNINAQRDSAELLLCQLAYNRNIPMLGICRGMQTIAMTLGGHVQQDIVASPPALPHREGAATAVIKHSQNADRSEATHSITIAEGSLLASTLGGDMKKYVNSFHHQAVDNPGPHFRAVAHSNDGVIEAMESCEGRDILGVQWHPECMGRDGLPLFLWLCHCANDRKKAVNIHRNIVTLDSHCDTPMFFHQGVDFLQRDERIKMDLHKMTEGYLDAAFMACYIPQPTTPTNGGPESHAGKSFSELVHYDVASPAAYVDFIFDEIERIVKRAPDHLALAKGQVDILRNKLHDKKSILLGIENGLAIGNDLSLLQHFKDRGVTYMTLCHNGNNDICDSAYSVSRGVVTHNGVSEFGIHTIAEMNRLGILVDLSHASEKSFYDAIDISMVPIVCSHSSCRVLCDHPRNLTNEQMRALARSGGIMQITIYNEFLKADGTATIYDAIKHLEHAISVMGIEHVGIGTDFDGDGGVPGMNDASDALNFTKHLLRRRFNKKDIERIWGGNWIDSLTKAQLGKRV